MTNDPNFWKHFDDKAMEDIEEAYRRLFGKYGSFTGNQSNFKHHGSRTGRTYSHRRAQKILPPLPNLVFPDPSTITTSNPFVFFFIKKLTPYPTSPHEQRLHLAEVNDFCRRNKLKLREQKFSRRIKNFLFHGTRFTITP